MRARLRTVVLALVAGTAACTGEAALEPPRPSGLPTASAGSSVPPASSYTVTAYPVDGWFADVNRLNLAVGMGNGRAIALPWGGTLQFMSSGPGIIAKALAVNTHGMIVGAVSPNCCAWQDLSPAVWQDYTSYPKMLPDTGEAVDINDQAMVVGSVMRWGLSRAFLWDLRAGTLVLLPSLPRGRSTTARAINNDQLILGTSDNGRGAMVTVLWRQGATGWTVQRVGGGIDGLDLDSGTGIVGSTATRASYGQPHHAGYFYTMGYSWSEAVSPRGDLAVGTDAGAATGWPVSSMAFIADRGGTTTWLPWPAAGTWREGFGSGVTDCGLVVGSAYPLTSTWQPYTAQPVVWDPGC